MPAPSPALAAPDLGDEGLTGVIPATLAEQLDEGERVFVRQCAHCHDLEGLGGAGPPLAGPEGLGWAPRPESSRRERFHTTNDVVRWVRAHMPADRPGTLSEGAYYNVTAYLLAVLRRVPLPYPLVPGTADTVPLP